MNFKSLLKIFGYSFGFIILVSLFQNCSSPHSDNIGGSSKPSTELEGNGEGYPGKLVTYEYNNSDFQCIQEELIDSPPPSDLIIVRKGVGAHQIRRDCQNIKPKKIQNFPLDGNVELVKVSGQSFNRTSIDTAFDALQKLCPNGKSLRNEVVARKTLRDPFDFLSNQWHVHNGTSIVPPNTDDTLDIQLGGGLYKFPKYLLVKNPAAAEWSRLGQLVNMQAGVKYALVVLVQSHSKHRLRIMPALDDNVIIQAFVDLNNGKSEIPWQPNAIEGEILVEAFDDGYYVTLFFKPTISGSVFIGLGPEPSDEESSLHLSAVQMFSNIKDYCR